MRIVVETTDLKKILPESAIIEVERWAIEKIAEEIKRKVASTQMDKTLTEAIKQYTESASRSLKNRFTFPEETKVAIRMVAKEAVDMEIENQLRNIAPRVSKASNDNSKKIEADAIKAINSYLEKVALELNDKVNKMARESFISVISEVKGIL